MLLRYFSSVIGFYATLLLSSFSSVIGFYATMLLRPFSSVIGFYATMLLRPFSSVIGFYATMLLRSFSSVIGFLLSNDEADNSNLYLSSCLYTTRQLLHTTRPPGHTQGYSEVPTYT